MASISDSPFQSFRTENLLDIYRGRCPYLIQSALPRKARITSYKNGGQRGGQISEKKREGWPGSKGSVTQCLQRLYLVSPLFSGRVQKFSIILHLGNIRQRHSSRQGQPKKNRVFPPGGDKQACIPNLRDSELSREDTAMQNQLCTGSEVCSRGWKTGIIMITFKLRTHLEEQN